MLYSLLKMTHILFAITAVGTNITYGVWQGLGGTNPEHESFALRGVKFLDDRVANPAYLLVLASGLTMAGWHWSYTHWIAAAIIIFVVLVPVGFGLYSPALVDQIRALEHEGRDSAAYRAASIRATALGIGLFLPILGILFMMVVKPAL